LDRGRCVGIRFCGVRPGLAARQRRIRGGSVRRRTRHAAHLHPARRGLEAAERSSRTHVDPVCRHDGGGDEGRLPEAARGERPLDPNAPQLEGTGEIRLESADRASGYFTTRADARPKVNERTVGIYLRADPADLETLEGRDNEQRAKLIAERLGDWEAMKKA
jgi:hypothetical protein